MEKVELLKKVSLFNGLPEDQLGKLASITSITKADKGKGIIEEGGEAIGFYAVLTGKVKVYKVSMAGKEKILHILGPGSIFAEVPVFSGGKFPASAMALANSELLFIPRIEFRRMIAENPDMSMNMLAILSLRLREFTRQIEALSLKEVPDRLAAHFLFLRRENDADVFKLDMPKGQLASLIGTIPETLSRVLRKMQAQDYIQLEGAQVTVLDPAGLEDIASGEVKL